MLDVTPGEAPGEGQAEDDIRDLQFPLVLRMEEQADVGPGELAGLPVEPFDRLLDARGIEGQDELVVPLEVEEDREDLQVVGEDQVLDGGAGLEAEPEVD